MSTNSTEAENGPQKDDHKPADTQTPEPLGTVAEATPGAADETFRRAYVEELRQEAAKNRVTAKKSDELAKRLVRAYVQTHGTLHDPRDLPFSNDLMDDDGFPDPAKVTSAVEALIKERPHLAKIRPVGDVGQGISSDAATGGLAAFGNMLRDAAS